MYFILSKVLYFLIKPLTWVIGLLLYSLLSKKKTHKKWALIAGIVLAILFSNRFIVNQVLKVWELKTITADQIVEPYDVGILLGGFTNSRILPQHDRLNFGFAANRFINTYELYRAGKIKHILITSGSGDVLQQRPKEALMVRDFLLRLGVPDKDISIEYESRNTYENAVFTKELLDKQFNNKRLLLITSASHMRRSIGCFRQADIEFTPFSVDYIAEEDRWSPEYWLIPDSRGFYYWEILIKEWIGYIAYWIRGYL